MNLCMAVTCREVVSIEMIECVHVGSSCTCIRCVRDIKWNRDNCGVTPHGKTKFSLNLHLLKIVLTWWECVWLYVCVFMSVWWWKWLRVIWCVHVSTLTWTTSSRGLSFTEYSIFTSSPSAPLTSLAYIKKHSAVYTYTRYTCGHRITSNTRLIH